MSTLAQSIPKWLDDIQLGEPDLDVGIPTLRERLNEDEKRFADLLRATIEADPENVAVCSYLKYGPEGIGYDDLLEHHEDERMPSAPVEGPMCVVGHVIWRLIPDRDEAIGVLYWHEGSTSQELFGSGNVPGTYTTAFRDVVNYAQQLQDSGVPWKYVLAEFESALDGGEHLTSGDAKRKYEQINL